MLLAFAFALLQASAPAIADAEIAVFQGGELEIDGSDFGGLNQPGLLVFKSGSATRWVLKSSSFVLHWDANRIVVDLPANAPSGSVRVATTAGVSPASKVEVYAYDWFDIPPTAGTNASPLSLAIDDAQRVWVNEEFHRAFQRLDISTGMVTGLAPPYPTGPGPFASTIFGDHRTQTSSLGEGVMVDPLGRIWFSEGGGYLYSGIYPNHSRIICLLPDEPGGPEFRVYNVPGDWNEVIGLTWDPVRDWVWFAEGGLTSGGKIVGFDPDLIPWDNQFNFSTSLNYLVGNPGAPTAALYHVYDVPNLTAQPAHLLVKANGDIWFTHYWGAALGRLVPATGAFTSYPLPATQSTSFPASILGAGPWEIVEAPNGDVIFNEFFDATITRFDIALADDPATWQLAPNGLNPGMTDVVIPDYDPLNEQLHSIAYAPDGRLWYTIHVENAPGLNASVGYISSDGNTITRLPPMETFQGTGAASTAGIAVDPISGAIYFCEFWRKRVGRLQRVPTLP